MHIKKYDFDYSRRFFLEKTAKGLMGAGVLTSLWPLIGNTGEIGKAYPEELQSLEAYTKGKVKEGDFITADNVDQVKDLLDPVMYLHVKQLGRRLKVVPQTRDITKLHPHAFLEATLRNQGKAALDGNGNVVNKADGKPWIGGLPFLDPQSGLEAIANLTLTGSHYDQFIYAARDWDLSPEGKVDYQYELGMCEKNAVSLVSNPNGPYWAGHEDKLKYSAVWFVGPNDVKGTSFLNTWKYDQREFPDLFGYLPAFKRVRRFPSNQRFEPLVPGITVVLSDFWAAGDPMLTWGNYKIVGRQPFLGSMHGQWQPDAKNWEYPLVGGPKNNTFMYVGKSLIPEVIVLEAEPTGYPRAPVSKKRVYIDARMLTFPQMITFDRRGDLWKSFEPGFSQYKKGDKVAMAGNDVAWSWSWVISNDVQSQRITRFHQAESCAGGWKSQWNMHDDVINKYMTVQAMQRLGT